ncbi:MAG: sugar phosphate isomerase/epimerase family protein [bacterium]
MKVAISSWSFHRTIDKGMTQKEWIKKCSELNVEGLELLDVHFPSASKNYLREIKKMICDLGLDIACVSVCNNFAMPSKLKVRKETDKVKKWLDTTLFLGSSVMRIFAGGRVEEKDKAMVWPIMINSLKTAAGEAKERGITLAIENHGRGFTADSKATLKILKAVKSSYLRLTLDTGNFVDLYPSIQDCAPYAAFVHAKTYEFDEKGQEKKLDYLRIMKIFKKIRYRGYFSVEYEGEDKNEEQMVKKSVEFLKRFL